jgi:hypothetical protein
MKESKRLYYILNADKRKSYDRQYQLRNKDKVKESKREYHLQNLDKMNDSFRQYRLLNRDKIQETMRWRHSQEGDKFKDYDRQYYLQNKDKLQQSSRQYHLEHGAKRRDLQRRYYLQRHSNPEAYLPRTALKSWKSPELVREYFESIAKYLHIVEPSDWQRISRVQLRYLGGMLAWIVIFVSMFRWVFS